MNSNNRFSLRAGLVVLALTSLSFPVFSAEVGRVILSSGDTFALRGTRSLKLAFGDIVEDRDILRTGPASNLQVRFVDESLMSLKENSELGIDEFRFSGRQGQQDRAFFRLVKGGLRTITGLIGKTRHNDYALRSVTSTIGIRGTDYAATLCQGDCRNADGSAAKDGLYGRVIGQSGGTNSIVVSNQRFERRFGINENFFVADANSAPQPLLEAPAFVTNRLESRGKSNASAAAKTGDSQQTASSTSSATSSAAATASTGSTAQDSRVAVTTSTDKAETPAVQTFVASEQLSAGGTTSVVTATQGMVYAVIDKSSGTFVFPGQLTQSGSKLTAFNISGEENGGTFTTLGSTALANVVDTGSGSAISVSWGRWTGGSITLNGSTTNLGPAPNGQFHYMIGELAPVNVMAAKTGTIQFNHIGGTTPTDSVFPVNTASSYAFGSISVNFSARTATLSGMSMNFPTGVNYGFSAVPLTVKFDPNVVVMEGGKTAVACTGGPCGTGASATLKINGGFLGPAGNHYGAAFMTQSVAGTTSSVQVFASP